MPAEGSHRRSPACGSEKLRSTVSLPIAVALDTLESCELANHTPTIRGTLMSTVYYDSDKARRPLVSEFQNVWTNRALIRLLVGRDLTVRYKRSILGVWWTFLNPLLTTGVMWIASGPSGSSSLMTPTENSTAVSPAGMVTLAGRLWSRLLSAPVAWRL